MFSTLTVGCDPTTDGGYTIYYSSDGSTPSSEPVAPGESKTVEVKPGLIVTMVSAAGDSDEAWMVETASTSAQIPGRGPTCSFMMPGSSSGLSLRRETINTNLVNTISRLTGGMANYTYMDFSL